MTDISAPQPVRPGVLSAVREMRLPFELVTFGARARHLINAPRGDGRPVMLLPGYMAGEMSMQPLAAFLRILGYRVYQWGIGQNRGDVYRAMNDVGERVEALCEEKGEKLTLVGWSLGGVISREIAREFPDSVREIITLGSPIIGGPKYTTVGSLYALQFGVDLDAFEEEVHDRNLEGLPLPATSIYSRSDGIVDWRACIDPYNDHTRHIEVESTHFGLGVNPKVWRTVAETLAGQEA